MMSAAYAAMITENSNVVNSIITELVWHAGRPNLNFANRTLYPYDYYNDANPLFIIDIWVIDLIMAYDICRAMNAGTTSQRNTIENWFLALADLNEQMVHRNLSGSSPGFSNRKSNSYTSRHSVVNTWLRSSTRRSNGTIVEHLNVSQHYNNRRQAMAGLYGLVGALTNNTFYKEEYKRFMREWLMFGNRTTANQATFPDHDRGGDTFPQQGLQYDLGGIGHWMPAAEAIARQGDTSLYDFSSSEGSAHSTWGSNHHKTMKQVLEQRIRWIDGTITPQYKGSGDPPSSSVAGNEDHRIKSRTTGNLEFVVDGFMLFPAIYYNEPSWVNVIMRQGTPTGFTSNLRHQGSITGWRNDWRMRFLRSLDANPYNPTPTPQDSDHFLYSAAEVTEYQSRMSGAGPYYSTGQGINGSQSNAPGDGSRALSGANAFLSNPNASRYTWVVPIYENSPWGGGTGSPMSVTEAVRPMQAAWCAMTLPNHANNQSWRNEVKAWLLWNATRSQHDYRNSSNYPLNFPNWYPSPIFAIGGFVMRAWKARDMLGRDEFTSSENATLDNWFYWWANYITKHVHNYLGGSNQVPGRLSFNFSSSMSGDYTSTNSLNTSLGLNGRHYPYEGGPIVRNSAGKWNNRVGGAFSVVSLIANELKAAGVTPSTSGTPSYGWYTVDEQLHHLEVFVREFLHFSVHPAGFWFDYHRSTQDANTSAGWSYGTQELLHMVEIAHGFALRGDMRIFNLSTTSGHDGTAGNPNIGGFSSKSLHFAAWAHARYVNDAWGRVPKARSGDGIVRSDTAFDTILSALMSRYYPSDTILNASWRRSGQSMPGYPASPQSFGRFSGWTGTSGTYIGLIEVGGV